MADGKAKVFYLTYERYESLKNSQDPNEHIDANSFYVVSETSQLGSNMLSLYLGEAKQCDLLDITQDVNDPENPIDYVDFINNDNIPESYKIPDKLLFYKQGTYGVDEHYSMLMYYVPEGEDRQQGRFIQVGDSSSIKPDNLTILLNQATNEIYGVGANLEGKEITYGVNTYTGAVGATVYNDYVNNKNAGQYSNVFGSSNADINGEFDTIFGYQNTVSGGTVRGNTVLAENVSLSAPTIKNNLVSGSNITVGMGGNCEHNTILGSNHNIGMGNVPFINNLIFGYGVVSPAGSGQNPTKIRYSIIGGKDQKITGAADGYVILGLNSSCVNCYDGSTILGSGHTVTNGVEGILVAGRSNEVDTTYSPSDDCGAMVVGDHLNVSQYTNFGFTVLGKYNDISVKDSIFTIGNGTGLTRSDAIRLSNTGLLQVCGTDGDVVTATGNNLNTEIRTVQISTTSHTFLVLPFNGKETILQNTVSPYTISSIEISDITYMSYNNGRGDTSMATSDDYNSVIVFKKGSSMTTADSVLANFTDPDLPKIYLLNPDIDISSFTIIHVMLFNDGFHICAIVAGYEEAST